jgi:hypothetical protein
MTMASRGSGADLSALKHRQKFLRHLEQQQEHKQSKLKHASASFASPPTKKQSAPHATTLFHVEDDDDDISSHSQQHPQTTQTSPVQSPPAMSASASAITFFPTATTAISATTPIPAATKPTASTFQAFSRACPPLPPATPYGTPFATTPAPQFATQFNFMAPPVPPPGPPPPSFSLHTMPPGIAPHNTPPTSSFLQKGHVPGSQPFGVPPATSAQQPQLSPFVGQQPTASVPTFVLTDPATFNGSNAAYWFMALLSTIDPTFTRAQECDTQTGNPILASTIPPNTVFLPATLNEQFKQKMLVSSLSEQPHHPSNSHTKWWRDSAFNIMASASIAFSHIPDIERFICTVKDRSRSTYRMLPFKYIPRIVLIQLMKNVIFWLNSFPARDGVSTTMSPRCIMTGQEIDYNKHKCLEFGEYVQTHNMTMQ